MKPSWRCKPWKQVDLSSVLMAAVSNLLWWRWIKRSFHRSLSSTFRLLILQCCELEISHFHRQRLLCYVFKQAFVVLCFQASVCCVLFSSQRFKPKVDPFFSALFFSEIPDFFSSSNAKLKVFRPGKLLEHALSSGLKPVFPGSLKSCPVQYSFFFKDSPT